MRYRTSVRLLLNSMVFRKFACLRVRFEAFEFVLEPTSMFSLVGLLLVRFMVLVSNKFHDNKSTIFELFCPVYIGVLTYEWVHLGIYYCFLENFIVFYGVLMASTVYELL